MKFAITLAGLLLASFVITLVSGHEFLLVSAIVGMVVWFVILVQFFLSVFKRNTLKGDSEEDSQKMNITQIAELEVFNFSPPASMYASIFYALSAFLFYVQQLTYI